MPNGRFELNSDHVHQTLDFIAKNSQFFLNYSMASCKAIMDAAHGIPFSTVVTATAITAVRRTTFSSIENPMPGVTRADQLQRSEPPQLPWTHRYDMRALTGHLPTVWDGTEGDTLSQMWVRDVQERHIDFASLTALADSFFPRVFLRRRTFVPIGTVSMTVYFHADTQELAALGSGFIFGQAKAQCFFNGFFDQSAQLWSDTGQLLATTHQVVYFKE